MEVDRETVVPGDVLALWPGIRISADGRLLQSSSLQVEEAALTGASHCLWEKNATVSLTIGLLPDRKNMVYGGTLVTRGEGLAMVVATGMERR